jgi:hypothetical protein
LQMDRRHLAHHPEGLTRNSHLILRSSRRLRLEGSSSALWSLLRDAAARLLRMRGRV